MVLFLHTLALDHHADTSEDVFYFQLFKICPLHEALTVWLSGLKVTPLTYVAFCVTYTPLQCHQLSPGLRGCVPECLSCSPHDVGGLNAF